MKNRFTGVLEVLTLRMEQGEYSMPFILKRLGALLILGIFCLAAFPANSIAEGNSDAADVCKQGGYADLTTSSGEAFDNTGECVSYAAQGNDFRDGETVEVTPEPSPEVTPEPDETPVPQDPWVSYEITERTGYSCFVSMTIYAPGYDMVYVQIPFTYLHNGSSGWGFAEPMPATSEGDGWFSYADTELYTVNTADFRIDVYSAREFNDPATTLITSSSSGRCHGLDGDQYP